MSKDFGASKTIIPAEKASKVAVVRVEIFTPVHNADGEYSHIVTKEGQADKVVIDSTFSNLDPLYNSTSEVNNHRVLYIDYVDDQGARRVGHATVVQLLAAGLTPAKLKAAHDAVKALAYDDAVMAVVAGLPAGGTISS